MSGTLSLYETFHRLNKYCRGWGETNTETEAGDSGEMYCIIIEEERFQGSCGFSQERYFTTGGGEDDSSQAGNITEK